MKKKTVLYANNILNKKLWKKKPNNLNMKWSNCGKGKREERWKNAETALFTFYFLLQLFLSFSAFAANFFISLTKHCLSSVVEIYSVDPTKLTFSCFSKHTFVEICKKKCLVFGSTSFVGNFVAINKINIFLSKLFKIQYLCFIFDENPDF